jgi:hypothetical protein
MKENVECQICSSVYNNSTKKRICCMHCNKDFCRECCKTYLLAKKEDAHCPSCLKTWDRMFLSNNFPQTWLHKEYKKHREDILEERHDAILYTFQPHVVSKNRIKSYENDIRDIKRQIRELYSKEELLEMWKRDEELFVSGRREVQPDPKEILMEMRNTRDSERIEALRKLNHENILKQRGPCPKVGCKGYIADKWMCGVCNSKICKECMIDITETEESHVCKKEDKESAALIRSTSKNCPSCRIRIFKVDGCNQMWCTNCKTFFEWNTLEIIRSQFIHNPHFIEYLRMTGHDETSISNGVRNNNVCLQNIELLQYTDIHNFNGLNIKDPEEKELKKQILKYFQKIQELIPDNRHDRDSIVQRLDSTNRELGISYLQNKISRDNRKFLLQRNKKELDKLADTLNVRELWADQAYHYIYSYVKKRDCSKQEFETNMNKLNEYCKKSLEDIGTWYNSRPPKLYR